MPASSAIVSGNRQPLLPGALVIGAMRAGTTWIDEYLRARGDVGLPQGIKETFFFERNFYRGTAWYADHFLPGDHLNVEVGPSYLHATDAPERVHQLLGNIPLVCSLREPVSRTFSHYLHERRKARISCDFELALKAHPELIEASRFASQLQRWWDGFGRDNVRVLFYDQLRDAPHEYAAGLCEHFKLPFRAPPEHLLKPVNQASLPASPRLAKAGRIVSDRLRAAGFYSVINAAKGLGLKSVFFGKPAGSNLPRISQQGRARVLDILGPEIESLETMLSVDLSHWKHR